MPHLELFRPPIHFIHTIINEQGEVDAAYAGGRHFDRAEDESEDKLCQRVCTALGWEE